MARRARGKAGRKTRAAAGKGNRTAAPRKSHGRGKKIRRPRNFLFTVLKIPKQGTAMFPSACHRKKRSAERETASASAFHRIAARQRKNPRKSAFHPPRRKAKKSHNSAA